MVLMIIFIGLGVSVMIIEGKLSNVQANSFQTHTQQMFKTAAVPRAATCSKWTIFTTKESKFFAQQSALATLVTNLAHCYYI